MKEETLTGEPLLDERVHVVRDEGHGREVSGVWLADDLDAPAFPPLPVDIRRLHTAAPNNYSGLGLG